jgi:spoIIIJ-associated protein
MTQDKTKITQVLENTLKLLDLSPEQFTINHEEDAIQLQINLPESETGLFIGNHGEGLASLQLVLALMLSQRLGEWVKLSVNINDYKNRREESLCALADTAAAKAIEINQEIIIPNLSSYERRLVHLHLEKNPQITTTSRGEGNNRQLFVLPKV